MKDRKRQCSQCRSEGKDGCKFTSEADSIAEDPSLSPEKKLAKIADLRTDMRNLRECPNINYNPPYKGMENL